MVRLDSENCHVNLCLSAVCDCGNSWSYSLTFWCLCCWQCKTKLSGKECAKALGALSWVSYHALPLPHRAVGVIVAVPGRTHLLFKLIFSIQFLKVVLQEQQHFLWWCPVSFAGVLREILTMNQTQKWTYNCNQVILSGCFCEVVQINLLSEFR